MDDVLQIIGANIPVNPQNEVHQLEMADIISIHRNIDSFVSIFSIDMKRVRCIHKSIVWGDISTKRLTVDLACAAEI